MNYPIQTKRSNFVLYTEKKYHIMDFTVPQNKIQRTKTCSKYLDFKELTTLWNTNDSSTNHSQITGKNNKKKLVQRVDEVEIQGRLEAIQIMAILKTGEVLRGPVDP